MKGPESPKRPPRSPARSVAKNIISKHGKAAFQKLIESFQSGESSKKIVEAFGVSRQRVAQWKNVLGRQHVLFEPDTTIADLCKQAPARTSRRIEV